MTSAEPGTSHRTAIIVSAVVIVLLAVGAAVTVTAIARHRRADKPRPAAVALHTTTIVRRTLSNDLTLPGRLQYVGNTPLVGHGTGTVTELPELGRIADRGTVLYRVDDQPVVVFYGQIPMFRELAASNTTRGADVAMVADNLERLGYFSGWFPPDPHEMRFTPLLRRAVKAWQQAVGMPPTGKLDVGQVVVLPRSERVSVVTAHLGDPAAGPIATLSSARRVVALSVPADQAVPIKDHTAVQIVLASGSTVAGAVTNVVDAPPSTQEAGGTPAPTNVTVTPRLQRALGHTGTAAVQVLITTERHPHVLAVPISALLALKGGTTYAVQLLGGRLIGVTTGMFTADYVEISGTGLSAGLRVVTAT